ncbi:MAG: hypothetical protein V4556_00150 [Bacteroidota bacterium]
MKETPLPKLDMEKKMKEYMPSLFPLIGTRTFPWEKINEIVGNNFKDRLREYNQLRNKKGAGAKLVIESNLFDIIVEARKGDPDAIRLFTFFDFLLKELNIYLPDKKKELIISNLKGFLTNTDKNYRNYIGELSVLNNCLKNGFELISIEHCLINGKKIDFHIIHTESKKAYLLEVVNIHYNDKKDYTDEILIAEISGKLAMKLADKAKNLDIINFTLMPVIWANYSQLERIFSLQDKILNNTNSIFEPTAFCSYQDSMGENVFKFGTISSLLV